MERSAITIVVIPCSDGWGVDEQLTVAGTEGSTRIPGGSSSAIDDSATIRSHGSGSQARVCLCLIGG